MLINKVFASSKVKVNFILLLLLLLLHTIKDCVKKGLCVTQIWGNV